MSKALNDWNILVTRPEQQAHVLAGLIKEQGGKPVLFPTLQIKPIENTEAIKNKLNQLQRYNWLIFISVNAVNFAAGANNGRIVKPEQTKIAAVGNATARALQQIGLETDLMPTEGFNSRALLKMPAWKNMQGQSCLIIRGQGGLDILAETLRDRGALIDYLEVYQRSCPDVDNKALLDRLEHRQLDAVTVTSGEALTNLWAMSGQHGRLLSIPLIVISTRIAEIARKIGFKHIVVSEGPQDTAIIQTLTTLKNGENSG